MKPNDGLKILKKYQDKLGGEVVIDKYENLIRSPSPSFNFMLGNGHGLPLGSSTVLYGKAKSGKTTLINAIIGQLHRDDPEAVVVKFDTEMRDSVQLGPKEMKMWGIDKDRYMVFQSNSPDGVFDGFESIIPAAIDAGAKIKLVIIDSINNIHGRRTMNADTVMQQQVGDLAATLQDGIKRIFSIWRRRRIAVIFTAHVRDEMDRLQIMRGNTYRMGAANGVKHSADYFIQIEANDTKDGRITDDSVKDMLDKGEQVAHKIRARIVDSSYAPKRRNAEFTLNYNKGIINVNEEVFTLGYSRGVIERVGNSYKFDGQSWKGKDHILKALEENDGLRAKIMDILRQQDIDGVLPEVKKLDDDDVELPEGEDDSLL